MNTNQKIAQKLRETAARLIKRAEELESGRPLTPRCIHGEYTDEPFTGCKTCGSPKVVICSNPLVVGKRRNSKGCNAQNCKHFKASDVFDTSDKKIKKGEQNV